MAIQFNSFLNSETTFKLNLISTNRIAHRANIFPFPFQGRPKRTDKLLFEPRCHDSLWATDTMRDAGGCSRIIIGWLLFTAR